MFLLGCPDDRTIRTEWNHHLAIQAQSLHDARHQRTEGAKCQQTHPLFCLLRIQLKVSWCYYRCVGVGVVERIVGRNVGLALFNFHALEPAMEMVDERATLAVFLDVFGIAQLD